MSVPPGIPAPRSPLVPPPNLHTLKPGDLLDRIYDPKYLGNSFNPGRGSPTRFAPIKDSHGAAIPTLYAGGTRECAFHERIFHDVPLGSGPRTIPFSLIEPLAYCSLKVTRPITLAMLFTPDLALWGLTRADIIDTLSPTYPQTARWAEAIHHAYPDVQGLTWSSRLCEPAPSVVFFGDRVSPTFLDIVDGPRLIAQDADLLKDLAQFALRTGITILNPPVPGRP